MEISKEEVFKDMISEVIERYRYKPPGITRIFSETEYLLRRVEEKCEEKCDALIEKPWTYLIQYKNNKQYSISELSPVSICIAFKMLIWSRIHPDRLVSFLEQGGKNNNINLPLVPLPLAEVLVGAWLDAGLDYEKHQCLFDRLLSENQTCRELVFPRARYPSTCVNIGKTSLRMLLQQAKSGRSYEKNITELVEEIVELIKAGSPGIFPYYSRKRLREPRSELLAVLIIRNTETYFYIRCQDTYYELNRLNTEDKEKK